MLLLTRAAAGLNIGAAAAWRQPRAMASMAAGASKIPTAVEAPITLSSVVIEPSADAAPSWSGDLLVLPFWEPADKDAELTLTSEQSAVDSAYGGALADVIADHEFKGKAGSSAVIALPKSMPARRLAVVGLGKADGFKASGAAKLGAAVAQLAKDQKAKTMAVAMPVTAEGDALSEALQVGMLEAALLGLSPDTRYKTDEDDQKPPPLTQVLR